MYAHVYIYNMTFWYSTSLVLLWISSCETYDVSTVTGYKVQMLWLDRSPLSTEYLSSTGYLKSNLQCVQFCRKRESPYILFDELINKCR